jgi:ankyrin repeat protein
MKRARRVIEEVKQARACFLEACRYNPSHALVLLEQGTSIHVKDEEKCTPLHYACWYQPTLVQPLLDQGADIDPQTIYEETPLHMACEHQPSEVPRLLKHGANIHHVSKHKTTVLHLACQFQPSLVPLLLKYGADPHAKDHRGETPIDYAKLFHPEVLPLLYQDEPFECPEIGPCTICMERKRAVMFGCGHYISCRTCASQLTRCPSCRKDIVTQTKVYI